MALLFQIQPGMVAAIPGTGGAPLPIKIGDFAPYEQSTSIVTQMAVRRGANVQFVHTLQDLIFAYSFGGRIGQIMVAGLSFAGQCENPGGLTGIEYVQQWYEDNEIGPATSAPIKIQIGTGKAGLFQAYLTALDVDIDKPEMGIARFGLSFASRPRRAQAF